ncbi:MAG: ATP-binding protein [Erysipelotrichaceae bacterium]|nr:ATP-binding protein [Erysipelotrichaceae bacterium]
MEIVTKDNIKSIFQAGESSTVEFKTKVGMVNALLRNISAFANTEGGNIIIGYDERSQSVIGTSNDDFEIVKSFILSNKLEDVCNTYTIQHEEKELIVIQVEKSKSIVILGGGAYIRKGQSSVVLTSEDVVARIASTVGDSKSLEPKEVLERLENKMEDIYNELLRSQKAHEEELKKQKEEHEKEMKNSSRNNWFFCILSALIGWVLAKLF